MMAQVGAVKVERSRARGRVASNTLTAPTEAIPSRALDLFWVLHNAHPNLKTTKTLLVTVRFFEASAMKEQEQEQQQEREQEQEQD